jgi:putative DNA primase/helicase
VIVAGSVFGGADYKKSWRATDNALEPTAQQYSDALLILDELAQADPKTVGNVVYMLGNEAGKGRATQNATAKRIATWRLLFISDGEIPLSILMAEAGKTTKGGHDVRMAHINADVGKGFGVYETVHGFDGGAALSDHLVEASHKYYGTAGLAFIEWAVSQSTGLRALMVKELSDKLQEICPKGVTGAVSRVAKRFALVALAGEMATHTGITGWAAGEATKAAIDCFNDWLFSRGGVGNLEHGRMLALLPDFIRANGDSRFGWKQREMDDRAPKIIHQAGFRRMLSRGGTVIDSNAAYGKEYGDKLHPDEADGSTIEYFIDPKVFKDEVCKGYDARAISAMLVKAGVFEVGKDGKSSIQARYAGANNRYYKVSSEKLSQLQT